MNHQDGFWREEELTKQGEIDITPTKNGFVQNEFSREILRKAMKLNGKEMTKEAEKDLELLEMPMETLAGKVKRKIEDDNMFGHAIIWFYLFSMQFVYMAIKLNIFALTLNSVNVGSDIYLGFLLINIIELPGQIYSVYLVDRFGMKSILLGSEIIVSGCLMLTAYIEDPNVIISLVGAGKDEKIFWESLY